MKNRESFNCQNDLIVELNEKIKKIDMEKYELQRQVDHMNKLEYFRLNMVKDKKKVLKNILQEEKPIGKQTSRLTSSPRSKM